MSYLEIVCKWIIIVSMYLALSFFPENVYELYKSLAQWEKKDNWI